MRRFWMPTSAVAALALASWLWPQPSYAVLKGVAAVNCAAHKFVSGPQVCTQPAKADLTDGPTGAFVGTTDTQALSNKTLTDPIDQGFVVGTAAVNWTSNTTLAVVTGLNVSLTAGKTYNCSGHVTVTASGAGGGIKVALGTGDTLTATSMTFTATNWNGTTLNAKTTGTVIGAAIGSATAAVTDVDVVGSIVVNGAGTMSLFAAQATSNATTTTVGQGSTFACKRVN